MRRSVLVAGLMTAVLGAGVPAFAQFQPPRHRGERPQRGLFGSGMSGAEQSLALNVSFGAGYDNDLLGQATGSSAPLGPRGVGQFGFASASLGYSVAKDSVTASANVGGTSQYYPQMEDPNMSSFSAGMQVSWQAAKRTSLSASTGFAYSPNSLHSLYGLPVDAERPPDSSDMLNYAISGSAFSDWRTSASISQGLTEKLSATAGYTFYAVVYNDQQSNYAAHSVMGRLTYQISKSLGAYAGYGRTRTDYETERLDGGYGGRTIDAGVSFGEAVSLTRRTSLSFGTGVSGVDYAGETSYAFTGHVQVGHELGRSWTLTAQAQRFLSFYQTFGDPVVGSSASGGVSGLLNRRIQFGAQGGWSSGTVGVSHLVPQFDSWTVGASLRVATSRNTGLSFSYAFFDYVFDDNGAPLPFGTQPQMRNQSARVTFDLMVPLITVARRANASR